MLLFIDCNMSRDEPKFKGIILGGQVAQEGSEIADDRYSESLEDPDEKAESMIGEIEDLNVYDENPESGGSEEYVQEAREIADQISL
jgi:hypothetical protein